MKFITENDLRTEYNQSAFTDYYVQKGSRLTPGARQFLIDRRIAIIQDGELSFAPGNGKKQRLQDGGNGDSCDELLHIKIRTLENLILTIAHDFLAENNCFVQNLLQLYGRVNALHSFGKSSVAGKDCSKNEDTKSQPVPSFELNAFHLHAKNSAEILSLHRLLCAVEEFACFVTQYNAPAVVTVLAQEVEEIRQRILQLLAIADGGTNDKKRN